MTKTFLKVLPAASSVGTAEHTKFCTQYEKELAIKLHDQNAKPAEPCY
ncbi:hypothetical protein F441_11305 [Phytophthora nicotianae CJ01A1]|uniref:Uncharacterized protein n=6 Tax=Phytophthora nicotianae TaxID=4792 RepID=W2Q442_PHYN3|nr:hypothetical protein PPTG_23214 [Phytophthora nicotianae INRA-310]ETI43791.1 hypothetical protein F443_11388 [Phytophthora nicotianae P1569]ETK83856.1 hypothetical protein L915_11078 [Phytophthora nicotianae]ETO72467.1 hypothetical protein F444_11458 [Phytophthora nicotianae P1976]ETP13602.1 hypothetical protein F441_11305 [Phytophthora nicotianae CJ01A1]ETP41665.1 hypothetical protein F442_11273 [Phytophthora nicotianae P10297]